MASLLLVMLGPVMMQSSRSLIVPADIVVAAGNAVPEVDYKTQTLSDNRSELAER